MERKHRGMRNALWNWQFEDWPHFTYNKEAMRDLENKFLENVGFLSGAYKHIKPEEKDPFLVKVLSDEAIKTSEIEGEYLDRESVQESIKKNLGFASGQKLIPPAESGVAELMVSVYKTYDQPLTHNQLFQWHEMLTSGRKDLVDIGRYRTHPDPMQIVSGRMDQRIIFFEAPPSDKMKPEMNTFLNWFNESKTRDDTTLTPLEKAGIAHFYFVTIHPFEDGNGRIGRAIAEKSLSQNIQKPSLISLSQTIEENKKEYYRMLEKHNRTLDLTDWLIYFGNTIIKAQEYTIKLIDFLISKARFFDRYAYKLNNRQLKVVRRIFKEGIEGFQGGLSAKNYISITKTSASTATRDLKNMVDLGAFYKTGKLKGARYYVNLDPG